MTKKTDQVTRLIVAVFLAVLGPCFIASADDEHKSAMARLSSLEGVFEVTGVRHTPDGPVPLQETTASAQYILNGFVLEETSQSDMGRPDLVSLLTHFSYDPHRQVYRISVSDDTFGIMDVYEGRFTADGALIATNLRSDVYFPLEGGDRMHFQLKWDLSEPSKSFDVLYSTNGGATWVPFYEMVYKPILQ